VAPGDSASAIVVGAGAWGAAIADELVGRGWCVTLIEQWAPANARGSSGDRLRLLRVGYASDEDEADLWYARSALHSLQRWRALEREAQIRLLEPAPLVWLGSGADRPARIVAERLRAVGLTPEVIAGERLGELFPSIEAADLEFAVLEPHAAVIRAGAAVEALVARTLRAGARLELARAEPVPEAGAVRADGRLLRADRVIWACGSWLGRLFPTEAPVTPTWQDVLHWHSAAAWREAPAWFDPHEGVYGLPDVDGLGVKAATHLPGPALDLDRASRQVRADAVGAVSGYLRRRFPDLAGAPLLWGRVMHYEMTPDANFVIGARADDERSLIAGGGSGHGFKHAPAVGALVADVLEDRDVPPAMFAPGPRAGSPVCR
jgi:glycine/D-amino acid oxidase-like deaminating enzyme